MTGPCHPTTMANAVRGITSRPLHCGAGLNADTPRAYPSSYVPWQGRRRSSVLKLGSALPSQLLHGSFLDFRRVKGRKPHPKILFWTNLKIMRNPTNTQSKRGIMGSSSSGGKPKNPAERLKKVKAAQARWARPRANKDPESKAITEEEAQAQRLAHLESLLPKDRLATIADYDAVLGAPVSWGEVKNREAVITMLEEAQRRRGELISRKDAEEAAAQVYNTFVRLCDQLPMTVVEALVESLDTDARAKVRTAVQVAWDKIMEQVGKTGTRNPES